MSVYTPARTNAYYRTSYAGAAAPAQQPQNQRVPLNDNHERWYVEGLPNNRMILSLQSGIKEEVNWALERLIRLSMNGDADLHKLLPGLVDALFEWPQWYVAEGHRDIEEVQSLFAVPVELAAKRRHALESLSLLRNIAVQGGSIQDLQAHPRSTALVFNALNNLNPDQDGHVEFLLNVIEFFQCMAARHAIQPHLIQTMWNPVLPLSRIVAISSDRSLIVAALTALNLVLSHPPNTSQLSPVSPALGAAIRYLPLFVDKPLLDACLNYLYIHLSHPAMAKLFLLHPDMPSVLRLLVSILLAEQVEENVVLDILGPVHTVPMATAVVRPYELTKEELDALLSQPEPQRCSDWMKLMFAVKADGELTQVEFWNLYRNTFAPYIQQFPLLAASDVIKNVTAVFPSAQAMVLPGDVQKFVVRGVDRRRVAVQTERFKCLWDKCATPAFEAPGELFDHILEHIASSESTDCACLWSTCPQTAIPKAALRQHVLTHISSLHPPVMDATQDSNITLPSQDSPYPINDPTSRPFPPPRTLNLTFKQPTVDPPSTSLTALLCIRILFRGSFTSSEEAPRADADHFGFPGLVESAEDQQEVDPRDEMSADKEREGEMRGKRAFTGVRRLMEGVRLKDETLNGWIAEMVDTAIYG
ncbi:hypothetical protein FB45DRAFT_557364 [Roridomyces roridus]|uniref:RFX-type winged-helix domain-containing protein n=1 Tax=Roridomyces roridus TaxID=1738132 RepID=A0AAD7FLH2_9AGAR|nr:hypothetical protein FB45DRAFT_557364 [Roridomyces roridus]